MKKTLLFIVMLCIAAINVHAQYRGKCGAYRYKITGERITNFRVHQNDARLQPPQRIYYQVDNADYIRFWVEEIDPETNEVVFLKTFWARLYDIDAAAGEVSAVPNAAVTVKCLNKYTYFFTSSYSNTTKGPAYGVDNAITINFKDLTAANSFVKNLRTTLAKRVTYR